MADLTNLSDEELEQAIAELSAGEPVDTSGVFADTAARKTVDNFLNIGPATGNTLATGAAAARSIGSGNVPFISGDFSGSFDENLREERGKFPARLLRNVPAPTLFDIQAGAKSLFGPGEFEQYRDDIVEESLQRREAAPGQAFAGDITGDIVTLATGRTGFQRGLRDRAAKARRPDIAFGSAQIPAAPSLTPTFLQGARNITEETAKRLGPALARGGIKIGETGLEGALISAMNENDPLVAGALAAGAQSVGSTTLAATRGIFGNKGANLAIAAAGTMSFLQLFKEASPGGRDRILESSETAFAKLAALITIAGLSGAAGFGRVRGNLRTQQPEVADLITTLPRGGVMSLLSSIAEDDSGEVELVLGQLMKDPNYFGPTAQRRFERSLTIAGAPSLPEQIELLKSDRRFKTRLNALREPSEYERLLESAPTHQIDRSRVRD